MYMLQIPAVFVFNHCHSNTFPIHFLTYKSTVFSSLCLRCVLRGIVIYMSHRTQMIIKISINLLVVYRESVNLTGYITRRLSAYSLQL